jgi:hypothetical protein
MYSSPTVSSVLKQLTSSTRASPLEEVPPPSVVLPSPRPIANVASDKVPPANGSRIVILALRIVPAKRAGAAFAEERVK